MVIGGYWIGLTLFVVPALSIDTPWALVGLLQVVAALGLWSSCRGERSPGPRPTPGPTPRPWGCSDLAVRLDLPDPAQPELLN